MNRRLFTRAFVIRLAATAIAVSLIHRPATAAPRTVALVNANLDQEAGANAAIQLRQRLESSTQLRPLLSGNLALSLEAALTGESPRHETLRRAREALAGGVDSSARFSYDDALRMFTEAEDLLISIEPDDESVQLLSDVNLRRALVHFGRGKKQEAQTTFATLHQLTPGRALDPARFPPDVVSAFEQARPTADKPGALQIGASFDGTTVFVDGANVGVTPMEFAAPAGLHYVTLSKSGYRAAGRLVEVAAGQTAVIQIELVKLAIDESARVLRRRALADRMTAEDTATVAAEVARLVNASAVIVIGGSKANDMTILAYDTEKASARPLWKSYPAAVDSVLAALGPRDSTASPSGPIIAAPPPRPWYRKPWGIAAISGGVAVAVIAVLTTTMLADDNRMRQGTGICFPPDC